MTLERAERRITSSFRTVRSASSASPPPDPCPRHRPQVNHRAAIERRFQCCGHLGTGDFGEEAQTAAIDGEDRCLGRDRRHDMRDAQEGAIAAQHQHQVGGRGEFLGRTGVGTPEVGAARRLVVHQHADRPAVEPADRFADRRGRRLGMRLADDADGPDPANRCRGRRCCSGHGVTGCRGGGGAGRPPGSRRRPATTTAPTPPAPMLPHRPPSQPRRRRAPEPPGRE